ncbi:hypothetical protein H920_16593 [Fukomys damarensis]|uniref:Uncharacterized protein n=1 Tax=Fukomys damarensis TaxID=885580 RepID=A0A091CRW1_FUKDA|nr:hypothetical protein H920_16593 [Fukomys damarensis]
MGKMGKRPTLQARTTHPPQLHTQEEKPPPPEPGRRRRASRPPLTGTRLTARSTGAAWALPLLRNTAPASAAAAGAPVPGSRGWYGSGQSGDGTVALGGVHRGCRRPVKAAPYSTFLTGSQRRFPGTASRQLRPVAPGPLPEVPPKQRPGFRRPHSAPSLFGFRHLVGGGRDTMRMRERRSWRAS